MSRHTQNDGVTPDERIINYDYHDPSLAPSSELLGDYYKRGLEWKQFEIRYLEELRTEPKRTYVKRLAKQALAQDIILLCIEETEEHCHRRLLAEECQRYEPSLIITHR